MRSSASCATPAWRTAAVFDRAVLERAEQELKRQYLSRGRYAAEVQSTVTPLERNRVGISIAVNEGRGREDPLDQHRRQPGVQRAAAARPALACARPDG